jgi:hypothetical protein
MVKVFLSNAHRLVGDKIRIKLWSLTMKFILIFGPPAVGKMTVGYELAKQTGLKLFHNHMAIEPVLEIFEFGDPAFDRLVINFRRRMFEEVAGSSLPGLIFTYVWALDQESDKKFVDEMTEIFRCKGAEIYYVELKADLSERVERNATEFRLSQKPSKRDVAASEVRLLKNEERCKLNSDGDFFYQMNYVKIDNTHLTAHDTAQKIVEAFGFEEV